MKPKKNSESRLGDTRPDARPTRGVSYEICGLTGGIAAGKSTAARIFSEKGIAVVDADAIARELSSSDGAAAPALLQRFGTLDRSVIRALVFSDQKARMDLESILHPLIQTESARKIKKFADAGKRVILYEAALLVETGRYREFSGLIVVHAPRDVRRTRLIARDRMAPELADKILAAQASDDQRLNAATVLLDNTGSLESLKQKIEKLIVKKGWNSSI